jgi:CO/xanthine dehydrogenase Mo-binding subunit
MPSVPMSQASAIGRSVRRVDGGDKVAGLTRYAADIQLPGMLHARLVLSPHAHARIVSIDAAAALAVPGVHAVLSGRDLALPGVDPTDRAKCPLAIDRALFAGHPVMVTVADTAAAAQDAADLVQIEYAELPAAVDAVAAMGMQAPRVREGDGASGEEALAAHGAAVAGQAVAEKTGPNVSSTQQFTRGDVAQGFREADVVIERRYTTPIVHQGYLEPRACVASVDPMGALTVWTSTQALFVTRTMVAEALGWPEHQVKVVATPLGGGFGGKFVLLESLAAALTIALKRPVSVVMSRTEEFLATTPAPQAVLELKTGVKRDGTLTAIQARVIFDAGAFAGAPVGIALLMLGGCYRSPHLELRGFEVLTHKPGNGAYRAPGAVQAAFAMESQMDEMARALKMDPLDFRLANAAREGDPLPTGAKWPRIGMVPVLEALRAARARLAPAPAAANGHHRRGVGVAVGGWMGGIESATAVCRMDRDGRLTVVLGTVDMSGTNTVMGQIAAEAFGLDLDDVKVVNGDSDAAPYAGASGGSKVTYTVGLAVERAARDARRQLLAIAAAELEAAADDLEIADRAVRVRGVPGKAIPLSRLAKLSMQFGAKYEPIYGRGQSATVVRSPAFAAHLAEVEVDTETGHVRALRHLVAQDVGKALNPAAIEGQIQGAVAQGVGWALLERMPYDERGQLLTATLMDYALPQSDQAPPVETVIVEVATDHGPFGAKGVGEPPIVAAPAAIANAVADAVGARFTDLPITAEAVVRALRSAR